MHAFCITYTRTSNANNIDHNTRVIFAYKYEINKDLQNLPIIHFYVENMQKTVYGAQNTTNVKFAFPRHFVCNLITIESLLSKLHHLQVISL